MKKLLYVIFTSFIFITFFSCTEKNTIKKLDKKASVSALIHQNIGKNPILLLIKNDECDACKIFYKYINTNFEALVLPKLPEDTQVYQISINDFNSKNMWLFHVLGRYSFPTVLFIDQDSNISSMHIGADLYSFTTFLNSLKESPKILTANDLKAKSILLKSYIELQEEHSISELNFQGVSKINQKRAEFLSILLEGYYYKLKKNHPERVKYIKQTLQKSLNNSNQFYNTHKSLVSKL